MDLGLQAGNDGTMGCAVAQWEESSGLGNKPFLHRLQANALDATPRASV
jgi:hypothetical protein